MRQPTNGEAFSATEEEFFRAGEAMNGNEVVETEVVEEPRRSAWSRWFARTPRPATEPSF
jgi:hypothetical protein